MSLSVAQVADLYRTHADVVYRRCLTMLGEKDAAMDAVQEIFVKVLNGRLTFKGEADPTTWIYRITTNHALNVLRSRRPQIDLDELPIALHPACSVVSYEGRFITRQALLALVGRLDARSRAVMFLHFIEGLDQAEVARTLGISRRAVVKRLSRIRQLLELDHRGNGGSI